MNILYIYIIKFLDIDTSFNDRINDKKKYNPYFNNYIKILNGTYIYTHINFKA